MKVMFADSFYFFAIINPRDEAHQRAMAYSGGNCPPLLTTSWVLTEVADGLAKTGNRRLFEPILASLIDDPDDVILPPTQNLFVNGIELYNARPDKAWSLTDCISFVAMKENRITEALTGDHHFEQAGFEAMLK